MSSAPGLERLELRVERLQLTFRFTYAFHAREVRLEYDAGNGFVRVFPETFSFDPRRHDPAEIYLQFEDLSRKPALLSPRANRRDVEILIARLMLGIPRYLERVVSRLEGRLTPAAMARVYEEVALLAQILLRFMASRDDEGPGLRIANLHLRKLVFRTLYALLLLRVPADYLAAYVGGQVDPFDPADDLSEAGFFHTMEGGKDDAVNRSLVRLTDRAFHRWLEDVCLDEGNAAFEAEDSPFEDRETEVLGAITAGHGSRLRRARDLVPFLRRPGNRDCLRLLGKLEAWFLRQYDIHNAAVMIHHAEVVARGRAEPDRVLSRHSSRNYLVLLGLIAAPFLAAAVSYERAPAFFDVVCAAELVAADVLVAWFLLYRFCWQRNLTFFRSSVPRIAAGIIVGYLPIFFIDEIWGLATRSWITLSTIVFLLGFTTLLYLYIEVQGRIGDTVLAFARARQIFLLGLLQATGVGLVLTGLIGSFMASRNWAPGGDFMRVEALREVLPPFVGQLPPIVGVDPLYAFPSAVFVMSFMSFFIGTFLQLMWEDLPITEPL